MIKKLLLILMMGLILTSCDEKKLYCGTVVDKYLVHKKSSGEYNIVFYSDSIKANINVEVTTFTYVNTKIGDNVCFRLRPYSVYK